MVQSPSWEANWFAASQEISRIFMEPENLYAPLSSPIRDTFWTYYMLEYSKLLRKLQLPQCLFK